MKQASFAFLSVFLLVFWTTCAHAGGPKPTVSVSAPALVEQGTVASVDVSIDKAPGNKVTVRVDTEDGTAKAGTDYVPSSINVTFTRRGPRHVMVPITIMSNPSSTTTRTLSVELGLPVHANIGIGHASIGIAPQIVDPETKKELVRAFNDETNVYDTIGRFESTAATMAAIDPTLDWGGRLYTIVGNSSIGVDDMVCLHETAPSGTTYAIAYIVHGPRAGVYSGTAACPIPSEAAISSFGRGWFSDSDVQTQSELRQALFDEFYVLTIHGAYDDTVANMKALDPFLDWGGRLTWVVGNSSVGVNDIVCLQQSSLTGTTFSIAQVAHGPHAGTYFGKAACPLPSEVNFSAIGSSW